MFYNLRFAQEPKIIFEVGAYSADDELLDYCQRFAHQLYLFEPLPSRFAELVQKTQHLNNVHVFQIAISNFNGQATFNIANFEDCSSLSTFDDKVNETWINPWHPYQHYEMVAQIEVEVVRLDTFMAQQGLKTIDFLEVDTQGSDLRVVESLGDRIADVREIQIEVNIHHSPLYKNSFSKQDALDYFNKFQFKRHASWKQSVNREENIIFRNTRFYPNALTNFMAGTQEQNLRRWSYRMIKVRRVAQVVGGKLRKS